MPTTTAESATTADRVRTAAVLTGAVAQVAVGPVAARLGLRAPAEVSREHPTPITPPGWAFAVWGPIFAACAAAAAASALPGAAARPVHRRTGWWLAGAYGATTAWSVVEQSGRFRATAWVLPLAVVGAGGAWTSLQDVPVAGGDRLVPVSAGVLTGWTALAAVINVAAVAEVDGADLDGPRATAVMAASLAALAGAASVVVARSRRGGTALASTALWGLGTLAGTDRAPTLRGAAGAGALALAASAVSGLVRAGR